MIPPGCQTPSGSVTSAHQYVALAWLCSRELRSLHLSFAVSAQISATPVQRSAKNMTMWKRCGEVPRRVVVVLRHAARLPNLALFDRLRRQLSVVLTHKVVRWLRCGRT